MEVDAGSVLCLPELRSGTTWKTTAWRWRSSTTCRWSCRSSACCGWRGCWRGCCRSPGPPCWRGWVWWCWAGASKATWKLTWVLAGADLALLDNALFVCIAPGMALLACHAVAADRRWRGSAARLHPLRNSLFAAIALLGAAGLAAVSFDNRAWFFVLLAGASLANLVLTVMLIRCSLRWRQGFTAAIFLVSLLITLSLGGLARFSAGSAPLQWLAEILNAIATGSFAWAAWRLLRSAPALLGAGSRESVWAFEVKS